MRQLRTKLGGTIESPWFTADEAAAYLRIESEDGALHAFYLAYPRLGIPAYRFKGGRQLRFRQEDLDAALERARVQEAEPPRARLPAPRQPHNPSLSAPPAATRRERS